MSVSSEFEVDAPLAAEASIEGVGCLCGRMIPSIKASRPVGESARAKANVFGDTRLDSGVLDPCRSVPSKSAGT